MLVNLLHTYKIEDNGSSSVSKFSVNYADTILVVCSFSFKNKFQQLAKRLCRE